MPKQVDADTKVATIRKSIEQSPNHVRRVLCHRLLSEVGIKRRSNNSMAALHALLDKYGISADPDPAEAPLEGWVHLRLTEDVPAPPPPPSVHRPDDAWFAELTKARLTTEREVETRFVSRLFHALGYADVHEGIGLTFDLFEGVNVKHPEADVVYFVDDNHDPKTGNVLVLVECKAPSRPIEEAVGQAHSYAFWLKPMYYVVTNGIDLEAYVFRPGPIPDARVVRTTREAISKDFDEVYRFLSYQSVSKTKAGLASAVG